MRIVEIQKQPLGGHDNQTSSVKTVPDGWAIIPDNMETPNFPFGDIEVAEIDGVMTVTSWTPGEIPEPEPEPEPEPTEVEKLKAQVADLQNQILTMRLGG